jgi:hypothetical protein
VFDKGDHLEICMEGESGSHHCGGPDGFSGMYVPREDEAPQYTCEGCGRNTRHPLGGVYIEPHCDDGEGEYEQWCSRCIENDAWNCGYSGNYYTCRIESVDVNGMSWLPYFADMYAVKCEGTGRLYPKREVLKVHMPDGSTKMLSQGWAKVHYGGLFSSQLTDRIWPVTERAVIYHGAGRSCYCAKTELKNHAFQCDACDLHWQIPHAVR